MGDILAVARAGGKLGQAEALALAGVTDLAPLMEAAAAIRERGHGRVISYSRKIFIPLTRLCRDVCHYCTFATAPTPGVRAYLSLDEVVDIARAGAAAGCAEALFTLGDKPELRYARAHDELRALGHKTTLSYLAAAASAVLAETGLLPHVNPGVMTADDVAALRSVSVSQGLMLESASERLCERGGPHFGSPDKAPGLHLKTIADAGRLRVPFTTGILIGIGETRAERVESLLAIRDLQDRYGHVQEVIIQNFRAKPETRMSDAAESNLDELLWTIAVARLLFGPEMNIQAPPNLSPGGLGPLIAAGINDWGGVSPVTPDHVNPEAPWPHLDELAKTTAACGHVLVKRLAIYPAYANAASRWLDEGLRTPVLRSVDAEGFARSDGWAPGLAVRPPAGVIPERGTRRARTSALAAILERARSDEGLTEDEIVGLFGARGDDLGAVVRAADEMRREISGEVVRYVVNRNVNYTNVCYFRCGFCAFSKGKLSANLRGAPYDLEIAEIKRRAREAWDRGATEICLQGGIHPEYSGETYIEICRAVKEAAPDLHVHAFSPLEVWQGARTFGVELPAFLSRLRAAGLGTLPGTAAEVLDDAVRAIICPDKITTDEWLACMAAAHAEGFRTTATIMFGHVDGPIHWARHLLSVRALQARTGGFTEFVPLPFVHMESPLYLKGRARMGPTFREAVLMHAVARLALHPLIPNIQTSWVKMGPDGASACLRAGANDLGGTLMNETITRAAGAAHGQEMEPRRMEALIRAAGRVPRQRTTSYGDVDAERRQVAFAALPLSPVVNAPVRKLRRARNAQDGLAAADAAE